MAYIRKKKNSWQLQYYLDGKRQFKQYQPGTPKSVVMAEKKRIESELALHKAGIKKFNPKKKESDKDLTLREMTEITLKKRKDDVSKDTIRRNKYAMELFMDIVGAEMPVSKLNSDHFDQFRTARLEIAKSEYKRKGWHIDEDKMRRGVNKDLVNIRAVMRAAAEKGDIQKKYIPKIQLYKVDRNRLPKFLTDQEIIAIANNLDGEAKLAFWIIRYTGARRSEIARKSLNDDRGLKWKDIDWMRNKVRLYSKNQERFVTLHPNLRKLLLDYKAKLGDQWNPEVHVISFIRDTLTTYFHRAIKKAGINKPGAVHILRHSAGTKLLANSKNLRITQEFLGHKNITTTEIYTHVIQEEMDDAVNQAFN